MMWGDSWGDGPWAWMTLVMVIAVLLGATLVVWLLRAGHSERAGSDGSRSPQALLEDRFARGEISEEEFVRARDLLARAGDSSLPPI